MELTTKQALHRPRILTLELKGGDVAYVIAMSGDERDAFGDWLESRDGTFRDLYCEYLCKYLCTPDGGRIYADGEVRELSENIAFPTLEELFKAAMKENGMGKEGQSESKKE